MKNNKILRICSLLLFILVIVIMLYLYNDNKYDGENITSEDRFTSKELNDMEYVDEKIQKLVSDKSYKELSLENQVSEVEQLLNDLKNEGYISNFTYDTDMFNFEYSCGVPGGIMMKDFDPMFK